MFFTNIVINFQTPLLRHKHHALHVKIIRVFNRTDWWHLVIYIDWPIKQTISLQEHKCVKIKKLLRSKSETIPSFNKDKHYVLVIRTLMMSGHMNSNPCSCILVTPNFFGLVVRVNINLNLRDISLLLHPTNSYSCQWIISIAIQYIYHNVTHHCIRWRR